ncbi:MAG: HEAT repeat domain-containing protein, partial [candidate division WOR-3 bacterium]
GERDPPEAIPYLTKVPCRSPADAPFCAVFNEAFLPALLRMVGTLRGGDPLVTAALKDDAEEVRRAAARLLGEMGDAGTVRRLIDSLRSKSEEICSRACLALEEIGKPAVLPLIEALNDPNNNVRDGAACALGEIGDWRAVEPLIAALKDTDAHVRTTAAISLGNLKAYEAVGPLIEALADEDEFVRAFAAAALSTITGKDFGDDLDKWQRWWQEVYLKE